MTAVMTCMGTFLWAGLPVTSTVVAVICFSVAFIGFERLAILCGVIKW
ncbi:Hypothetical protein KNT65_gp156 [Escherichia phage EcS1]|uniref:Uncharacterized protein n=1 Tax=Escherichia phage EcS1 TaxID=2083276 RepID=A0A2Z5ZCW5_9CAUD|nr:Hypothetical protein KNT65_gp156 [Escherichia phage EcS1]BBC78337.1 Hypothetical protein [Escherichia phage EcS1]